MIYCWLATETDLLLAIELETWNNPDCGGYASIQLKNTDLTCETTEKGFEAGETLIWSR